MRCHAVLLFLLTLALALGAGADTGEDELRALLKLPVAKETGSFLNPEGLPKLRALLTAKPGLANQPIYALRDDSVSTPLLEAIAVGNAEAVRALLEFNAKPNLVLQDNPAPPLAAALTGRLAGTTRLSMVRLLLARGASPTHSLHIWAGCTNWTDRKTYFEVADVLSAAKAGLNSPNATGASPLQIAIVSDNLLAVEKLVALGATVDPLSKDLAYAGMGTPEGDGIVKLLKLPVPRR